MIGKITGNIDYIANDHVIVDVAGVGYNIFLTLPALQKLSVGSSHSFFIETHMREDHIHLYGFETMDEKQTFNLLISISGIGPRLGVAILSKMSPSAIADAMDQGNSEAFHSISGVGSKMAGRILIELKGKFKNLNLQGSVKILGQARMESNIKKDAVSTLISLGVSKIEAESLIDKISSNPDIDKMSLDKIVRAALMNRS